MTHSPDSNQNATPPPAHQREIGHHEMLAEQSITSLKEKAAANDSHAKEALRRLRFLLCHAA